MNIEIYQQLDLEFKINTRRKLKILLVLDKNKKLLRVFMRKFLKNDTKCIKNQRFIRERSRRMSKVYKGYELIKAIADGEIKERTRI